jgi:hypothetical protein
VPRDGYANLSVESDRLDELRRKYDSSDFILSFAQWAMLTLESSFTKQEYLEKKMSYLKFGDLEKHGIAIFDSKKNKLVRVFGQNNTVTCSEHGKKPCDHKIFAAMHAEFQI